jgi:NitT/TauT family transport system substrate-binding protein
MSRLIGRANHQNQEIAMVSFLRTVLVLLLFFVIGNAQAQTRITIAHTAVINYLGAFVAQEEGFFKKHGLEVTLQQVAGGVLVQGLQGGSVQVATVPPTAIVLAVEGGLDLVAVAGTSVGKKGDKTSAFVIGTDSGITTTKDLIGKKVGVPSIGGYLYVMARKWVANQGIDPNQVNFVEVNFPQAADLLKSGTIQASALSDPFLHRAMQTGVAKPLGYFVDMLPPNTTGVLYTATRQWVDANPGAVKAFRAAIREGVDFARKNPEAARADFAKYVKLPPALVASLAMPHLFPEVTIDQMRFWVDTMSEMKMIKGKPDPSDLIAR